MGVLHLDGSFRLSAHLAKARSLHREFRVGRPNSVLGHPGFLAFAAGRNHGRKASVSHRAKRVRGRLAVQHLELRGAGRTGHLRAVRGRRHGLRRRCGEADPRAGHLQLRLVHRERRDARVLAVFTNLAGTEVQRVQPLLPAVLTMRTITNLMAHAALGFGLLRSQNQDVAVLLNGSATPLDDDAVLWRRDPPRRRRCPVAPRAAANVPA